MKGRAGCAPVSLAPAPETELPPSLRVGETLSFLPQGPQAAGHPITSLEVDSFCRGQALGMVVLPQRVAGLRCTSEAIEQIDQGLEPEDLRPRHRTTQSATRAKEGRHI